MTQSKEWFESARKAIPGGVSSPVRSFRHVGRDPIYFSESKGAYLTDVDGKRYIDFCLSFGPHLLGHAPEIVVAALTEQSRKGTSFGACHPGEVQLARLVLKAYPFLDRVRLVNSGTEALMTAARLVRGATGRSKILAFEGCYHGHSDGFLAKAGSGVAALAEASSAGVPKSVVEDTLVARFDNLETVKRFFAEHPKDISAVILEPIPANHGLQIPTREHLNAIVDIAREHGALVVFDEVISGFRVGLSGACGLFDIEPDVVTLGKILGAGLPLAAVAGKANVLDHLAPLGPVYQAGTLSGNPLGTAAGSAVLNQLFSDPPYAALEEATGAFVHALGEILSRKGPVTIRHLGSMFWIRFDPETNQFPPPISKAGAERYAEFFRQALDAGVYFSPSPYEVGFLSTAHTPEVLDQALKSISDSV